PKSIHVGQRACRQEPFDLCEIAERGCGNGVLAVQCPRDLSGIERNSHLVLYRRTESLGQIEVIPALRVERTKEPKLVFDDWAANVAANVHFRETGERRSREREVLHAANQAFGCAIGKKITVELVATTLGDNVEDS